MVRALQGLVAAALACLANICAGELCDSHHQTDCHGNDLPDGHVANILAHTDCCSACLKKAGCNAWTWKYTTHDCYLKASCSDKRTGDASCHSGYSPAPSPPSPLPPSPSPPTPPPPAPDPLHPAWDAAYAKARATLAQMTRAERNSMMHSQHNFQAGYFVGNINAIERLGVPSLNMQDNGNGFRTTSEYLVGTVTCWPSALSMAATWDDALVQQTATAIGYEFNSKGANVILGPGVFVTRVAKGGRNFETLAGEDPYLGSRLAAQFVQGVQSQGVISTLKHFVFNNQENGRQTFNSEVDDKTAWELYYPPFQAGVNAGAGAVMCSYNFEDGKHSCSNPRRLKTDLKGKMGFRGFVMSDWGAEHGTSIADGEDMDQTNGAGWDSFNADSVSDADADGAVIRTLASIYKVGADVKTKCTGGKNCDGLLHADVQSGHHTLALQGATAAIVLLKNEHALLPLQRESIKTIRIVGSAAKAGVADPNTQGWMAADFYSGGGSGHVVPPYHITPYDGIKRRAAEAGITVVDSEDVAVDATIVVGGAYTAESHDRADLKLADNADGLIASLSGQTLNGKIIVLMQVPGVVLMPWRDSVQAIATSFYLGQETGNAWAAVLFGDLSPTGHLPISFPSTEADTIEPSGGTIEYSEGLAQGYRGQFSNAFAFGHGLSYTTYEYANATTQTCGQDTCVMVDITNIGNRSGATVPQLYLEFPAEANQPAPVLKGFSKTPVIKPKERTTVTFKLTKQDMAYWNGSWQQVSHAVAHIGAASDDIRTWLPLPQAKSNADLIVV